MTTIPIGDLAAYVRRWARSADVAGESLLARLVGEAADLLDRAQVLYNGETRIATGSHNAQAIPKINPAAIEFYCCGYWLAYPTTDEATICPGCATVFELESDPIPRCGCENGACKVGHDLGGCQNVGTVACQYIGQICRSCAVFMPGQYLAVSNG